MVEYNTLMAKNILSLISFLTIIPIKNSGFDLGYIAKNMYMFPLAGFFIGLIISIFAYFISIYVNNEILVGLIICIFILFLTGLHHTDALADVADGLMVHGNKETRKKVMHDPNLGIAGVVTIIFYILLMTVSLSIISTNHNDIVHFFKVFIIAEVISKYSMVLQSYLGKSSWEGYNTLFIKEMQNKLKISISTLITVIILFFNFFTFDFRLNFYDMSFLGIPILVSIIILFIANKKFSGISGDVLGSTNEITRLTVFILAAFFW